MATLTTGEECDCLDTRAVGRGQGRCKRPFPRHAIDEPSALMSALNPQKATLLARPDTKEAAN
jgi:hypothetical protein